MKIYDYSRFSDKFPYILTFVGILFMIYLVGIALMRTTAASAWTDGFCYLRADGEYPVYMAQEPGSAFLDRHWLKCTDGEPEIGWWGETD